MTGLRPSPESEGRPPHDTSRTDSAHPNDPPCRTGPPSGFDESSGTVAVVLDFVGATLPQLDELLRTMRLRPEGPGRAGSLFQWSRGTQDGVRVTEVWHSQHHFEDFFQEEIAPRLSEAGLREPEITTYQVHGYLTQGPAVPQNGDPDGSIKA